MSNIVWDALERWKEQQDLSYLFHSDEPMCESTHTMHYLPDCSQTVTHRVKSCQGQFLICNAIAGFIAKASGSPAVCLRCDKPCSECWVVSPA